MSKKNYGPRMSPYDIEGPKPDWYWEMRRKEVASRAKADHRNEMLLVWLMVGGMASLIVFTVAAQLLGFGPR